MTAGMLRRPCRAWEGLRGGCAGACLPSAPGVTVGFGYMFEPRMQSGWGAAQGRACPTSMPAWMAAPSATHASGFTVSRGATPASAATMRRTAGMRVAPPASTTCGARRGDSPPLGLQGSGYRPADKKVRQCPDRRPPHEGHTKPRTTWSRPRHPCHAEGLSDENGRRSMSGATAAARQTRA